MPQPLGAEARSQPRVRVSWRAQLILGGRVVECRTTDISEGGVGLKLADSLPAGQSVRVNLVVPDPKGGALASQNITGTIRVAFSVLSQDGVRAGGPWIELPMPARSFLSSFIRQQSFKLP
jgi:hypothetical protein